jgi:hypothetical protein
MIVESAGTASPHAGSPPAWARRPEKTQASPATLLSGGANLRSCSRNAARTLSLEQRSATGPQIGRNQAGVSQTPPPDLFGYSFRYGSTIA